MDRKQMEDKWPVLGRNEQAAEWLRVWVDLGRAPRTIDAYARGLAEYLQMCERENVDPVTASRAHVAAYVRELTSRPSRLGANVVSLDSAAGLANATLQQRRSRSGCFTTSLWRKDFERPIRSVVAVTLQGAGSAGSNVPWCRG